MGNFTSSALVKEFGVDGIRYYFLRYGPSTNDVDITLEKIRKVYNSDLANGLGNLVARIAKLSEVYKVITPVNKVQNFDKFIDENGNEVKVVVKVEMEGNEIERTEKTTITTPDGIEIILKNKVETEEGVQETKNSIEVKGFLVTTKLSVKEEIKNGATIIKSQLSTGAEQDIIVMPDEAHQIALDAIKAQGISIELTERAEEGVLTSVFMAESVKQGKLFGLFNINVDLQALINPITGELIEVNKPWWAFLVAGEDTNQAPVVEEISPISDTP